MRLNTRIAFAIGCVSLLALIVPAFGLPAPSGIEKQAARPHGLVQKPKPVQHAQKGKPKPVARDSRADRLISKPVTEPLKRPRFGWPVLVSEARKYLGTNPTARKKLWCATFMNFVLAKAGYAGTNSDAAKSFAYYGHRISSPQVGAIAVLTRGKLGGHVGVVTGIDPNGNPIIISGNHGHRVGEGIYPRSRVIAYVMPSDSRPLTQVADRSSPARSPELGLDSPITELIAAIEAEYNRAEPARPQPARASEPVEPPTPHRTVQQTPDHAPDTAQAARRSAPVDPSVADLFGLKDRAASPVPPRSVPVPQRQQHQPQRPGRIAAADFSPR
jgi:uncharacterized protein (TIGR02594 family)